MSNAKPSIYIAAINYMHLGIQHIQLYNIIIKGRSEKNQTTTKKRHTDEGEKQFIVP